MSTLIISDVHERLDRLDAALAGRIEKVDRVVFLGDWFDAFGAVDLRRVGQVCQFINGNIHGYTFENPDEDYSNLTIPATFLLGNHDCHYFFRHDAFKCSGYNPQKQEVIDANVPDGIKEYFRIYTRVGPYLVSHAGFTEATLQYARQEVEAEALRKAFAGGFDPIFGAGYARGGNQPVGGPTWLDWNAEFQSIDDCPQIVGHTNSGTVRMKGLTTGDCVQDEDGTLHVPIGLLSYCLDTALRHVAIVDEETGAVTIEEVLT